MIKQLGKNTFAAVAVLLLNGCGSLIDGAVDKASNNLALSMMAQDDPETVRQAAPAYLLLLDSFVQGDPENPVLLRNTAGLYSAYGSVFVDDPQRAKRLTGRAWEYAQKALCIEFKEACEIQSIGFDQWDDFLAKRKPKDTESLFGLATSWLTYVQAHADNYEALAQLPKAEALLDRLAQIGDGYEEGTVYLYLGIINSIRPPALGGNPDRGKEFFEKAIALSEGHDLSVKVSYARFYARTLYERELHDELLNEVLGADPRQGSSVLLNVMAQDEAKRLLATADDYF